MKVTIQEQNGAMVAEFEGRLDTAAASQAEKDLQPLFKCENCDIILDCTKMDYIASSGLRIFLYLLKETKVKDCKVIIQGANEYLQGVFASTGFINLFEFR